MKYSLAHIILVFLLCIECGSNNKQLETNIVSRFLDDISTLKEDTSVNPIISFSKKAKEIADEIIDFNKLNINPILAKSKDYMHCVIITSNHTIIKIDNPNDCIQSGSWGTCMPTVKGFIKKGKLNYKYDFMNNVIGIPDSQKRTAYYFNKLDKNYKKYDSLNVTKISNLTYDLSVLNFKSNNLSQTEFYINEIENDLNNFSIEYALHGDLLIPRKKVMIKWDEYDEFIDYYYTIRSEKKFILENESPYITCLVNSKEQIKKIIISDGDHDYSLTKEIYIKADENVPLFYSYYESVMANSFREEIYFDASSKKNSVVILSASKGSYDSNYLDEDSKEYIIKEVDTTMTKNEIIGSLENITTLIDRLSSAKFIPNHKLSYVDDKSVNRMRPVFSQNGFTMNSMLIKNYQDEYISPDKIDTLKQYRFTVNDYKTAYSLFSFYINFNYLSTKNKFIPSYDSISWNSETFNLKKYKGEGKNRIFSIFKGNKDGIIDSIKFMDENFDYNCTVNMKKVKDNIWAIYDYKSCFPYYECGL